MRKKESSAIPLVLGHFFCSQQLSAGQTKVIKLRKSGHQTDNKPNQTRGKKEKISRQTEAKNPEKHSKKTYD